MELATEYLPVDSLTPYGRNARKHGDVDIAAIRASIEQFGFLDPIGVWGPQNIIVEGHGRLLAAKALGMDTVPCIRLDALTDEQRRAYALAHNKTAELSGWDFAALEEELESLEIDMTPYGFESIDTSLPDGLFTESQSESGDSAEREPEQITCPFCGKTFER